jgi:uncharacterized phage protein (TIGR02218 family)
MKSASPSLISLFATNQDFEQFDLYTITLSSGLVLRYTNCAFDVLFGGNTWLCSTSPGSVVIDEDQDAGPRAHWTSDLNVGTWSVSVMPRDTDVIGNSPWLPAVRAGILDEATVRVDRGYVIAWPAPAVSLVPAGIVNVFFGRMSEIDYGRSSVQLSMNDPRELLATDMPRNLYSSHCRYALFDRQCTLDKTTHGVAVTVTSVDSQSMIVCAIPPTVDGQYALGDLLFTSGLNTGLRMMIRSSSNASGRLALIAPMPFTIQPGDTQTLFPGCDKTQSTCAAKFNNQINFGGFPYIPAAETAV